MSTLTIVGIGLIILVVTLIVGIPIPFSFASAFIFLTYALGFDGNFQMNAGYGQINSVVLLAIPLFVLAGGIMEKGNIGSALIGFVQCFVGRAKSGLGTVGVVTCAIFGAISGSASATLSCIGSIMEPRMTEAGYPKGYTASLMAAACPLGLLIPPSSAQILYAWSSNQSVLACFLATVVPGIILASLLCVVNYVCTKKMDIKVSEKMTRDEWTANLGRQTKHAVPSLLMPIIILGGIYSGMMTPTESAAVSVIYAIPVAMFVYKGMNLKGFKDALIDTSTTTGVIMVMFFMVMILSKILTMQNVPDMIAQGLLSITTNKYLILLMVNIFMIIIGMIMDDVSGILLCTPILLPIVQAIGIHPIHFAAILGVNIGMGNITPPTAPMLYLSGRICKARIDKMLSPIMIFIIFAWIPTLLLTTYFPAIATTLPKMFMPKLFM